MDVKYINPFIMAAQSVFRTMLGIEVTLSKPVIKTSRTTSGEVTGIMGLVGDRKGTITISFQDKGALFIYKTLIGDESTAINSDVVDAIGEITNIISGQARRNSKRPASTSRRPSRWSLWARRSSSISSPPCP